MLSNYQKYLNDKLNIKYSEKDKKLILDLLPKRNYKIYYKNLEYYMKLGIKIKKVHKILGNRTIPRQNDIATERYRDTYDIAT